MVYKIADNILSPLGETTAQNYQAVKAGRSALRSYTNHWQLPQTFSAALFTDAQREAMAIDGLTPFEAMVVRSVSQALAQTTVGVSEPSVVFILSTTKGNVELLSHSVDMMPATKIAKCLGFVTKPVVTCNACVSGLSALLLAKRLLETGAYDYAVVCGADCQSRFIVSGFQSLQVVAQVPCRPFDMERTGMSLGEAAATMILSRYPAHNDGWGIVEGAVRNDACHISAPAHNAEGACRALMALSGQMKTVDVAFINAHGTATMFNDQMESVAIYQAGLAQLPVNGYKGYYGHTLGAAGVLETILSMAAVDDHTILATKGYEERGVSASIRLSAVHQPTDKHGFVKMLSGFGGNNATLLVVRGEKAEQAPRPPVYLTPTHRVMITPESVLVDGRALPAVGTGGKLLTDLYRRYVGDYPRYYKMDRLSQLGLVASELLLQAEGETRFSPTQHRAVILFNRSSSIHADRKFQATLEEPDGFFPSPSLFVYTLPNIVAGEIAIRNHYLGETSFFILPSRDEELMVQVLQASCLDPVTRSLLCGWIDYRDDQHFEVDFTIQIVESISN